MKANEGFTLVELIMVIVLIGVLAAVAGPRFFSADIFEDRFFYDDVVHAARYARQFSVTKGCYTRLAITSSQFELQRDTDCNSSAFDFSAVVKRPEDQSENFRNVDAPAGTGAANLVFDSQGRAGSVSASVFTVYSSTQTFTIGSRTFSVDGETGFVR
ncbi:prepilin-type N-terminal cleavage/methylation domain-containing protein [Ketobacter sp. MCCC 1A13808]|uniref:prepilin-type N-terminal cleavage/methylation domain-containing protein n=1 Tax=Ketobacter sp. MCCC 1A13808 TaxID=2602738 RepID=UPI000F10D422|nr:prepilin-type N-terminal cleavage/methylation domain-containing protein [Ketobacter sp. MCCC 1A13808]MVF13875.1 prepilin-type N-terminal cleavage/methylation domain-containing protein [Ketobacter sp. MCCC 1A13808]RLP54926.1 MAG: type II secretion system protein [Ketobacter sp.]